MSHAAPVGKDGFFYAIDTFYVETSGHNRHRRATLPELRALFHPSSPAEAPKDPVGHWYEAQLLHYGLPPSKTKAVAKSRLLDALNKGNLAVPPHIQKADAELKKKWIKDDKEARAKLNKEQKGTAETNTLKRKGRVDDEDDNDGRKVAAKPPAKKKATTPAEKKATPAEKKATAAEKKAAAPAKKAQPKASSSAVDTTVTKPAEPKKAKQTARRGSSSAAGAKKTSTRATPPAPAAASPPPTYRTKQTARRGAFFGGAIRGGASLSGRGGGPGASTQSAPERVRQMARRGGPFLARRTAPWPSIEDESDDDDDDDEVKSEESEEELSTPRACGPLGLVNGEYDVECDELREWAAFDDHPFTLTLKLQGQTMWGAYDFGMYSGILFLAQRPNRASDSALDFRWRGRDNGDESRISCAADQAGWIKFLGSGRIEGMISVYGRAHFSGTKIAASESSGPSAVEMRAEWDGYNEDEYERQNRARWGGSGWGSGW